MDDQTAERTAKLAADNLRLRDEVKLLRRQLARAVPVGAPDSNPDRVITAMVDGLGRQAAERLAEERMGELEALQKRYDQLREEWDAERELTVRLHAEVDRLQRVAPVAEEPPPEWMRELWSDIYKHAYVAEVKSPAADADKALSKAKTRFGPEPLDTPEDTDEG